MPVALSRVALTLTDAANQQCSGDDDPRAPFVALMTAAAIAGHIIELPPERMHQTLDDVMTVAQAVLLNATETKQ